jgi:hypothetical protein
MRRVALPLILALALLPAATLAGPGPTPRQVMIEARITEVVRVGFDIGFKLPCPHMVSFTIGDPSLIQPYDPPAETRKQDFQFMVNGFGVTSLTALFTGIGGNCAGSASETIQLTVTPNLSDELKDFGKNVKGLAKLGKTLKRNELFLLEEELRDILDDFDDGFLSTNEAAAEMFGAAAASMAYMAFQLGGNLQSFSNAGTSLLGSIGATTIPAPLMTGAKGSLWGAAQGSTRECYRDFVAEVQELLCDAFEALAGLDGGGLQTNAKLRGGLPLITLGPRIVGDPDDDFVSPVRWLGVAAWSSANGSGLVGAGVGRMGGPANAKIDVFGPGGRVFNLIQGFEADSRQDLLIFVTPRILSSMILGTPAPSPAPGNWRFELAYEADTNPSDVFLITSP